MELLAKIKKIMKTINHTPNQLKISMHRPHFIIATETNFDDKESKSLQHQ